MRVSASGPVAAPAPEVWELLCDTSRYAEWVAGTDEVTRTDGPARDGSTYDEINPIAGPWKAVRTGPSPPSTRRAARFTAARASPRP